MEESEQVTDLNIVSVYDKTVVKLVPTRGLENFAPSLHCKLLEKEQEVKLDLYIRTGRKGINVVLPSNAQVMTNYNDLTDVDVTTFALSPYEYASNIAYMWPVTSIGCWERDRSLKEV